MKTIEDLYDGLFATLSALNEGKIKPDQAMAVAAVAQTIINAAKVECEYAKINKSRGTHFVPLLASQKPPALEAPAPAAMRVAVPKAAETPPDPAETVDAEFEDGDRVFLPSGKYGTVKSVKGTRVEVEHDQGGMFPYNAKQLSHATREREPITSPIVPQGARVIQGRYGR